MIWSTKQRQTSTTPTELPDDKSKGRDGKSAGTLEGTVSEAMDQMTRVKILEGSEGGPSLGTSTQVKNNNGDHHHPEQVKMTTRGEGWV